MQYEEQCVFLNLDGEVHSIVETQKDLKLRRQVDAWTESICRIPFKDRPDPYFVWAARDGSIPYMVGNDLTRESLHSLGGHWPSNPLNVDIYNVFGTHKSYHGWFGNMYIQSNQKDQPNTFNLLLGVTVNSLLLYLEEKLPADSVVQLTLE